MKGFVSYKTISAVFIFLIIPCYCFASSNGTVQVKGLRVISDGYGTDIDGLKPFNAYKGTSVACLASLPDGGIIKFDEDNSRIDLFVDNTGTNLKNDQIPIASGLGMMSEISSDRKAVLFEINGLNLPDKKATAIKASGHVALITATRKKQYKIYGVQLKVGSKFNLGDIQMEITKLGKPMWGEGAVSVIISSRSDMSVIDNIQFYDAGGVAIKSSSEGYSLESMNDIKIYQKAYNLQKQTDMLSLSVTCWEDMKTINVPFDFKVSVGF